MREPEAPTADPSALLLLQFLAWLDARSRAYAETMSAWRTSCPRLPVWEDATAEGLVRVEAATGARLGECLVVLTERGRAALAAQEMSGR
ncbi:hypothetical protein ACFQX4_21265 [Roseomonas sp. GCM10028921]